jgi:hypothetical protein
MTTTETALRAALQDLKAGRITLREYSLIWFRTIDTAEHAGREASEEVESAIRAITTDAVMGRA